MAKRSKQAVATDRKSRPVYWHGGAAGIAVGEALLPGTAIPGYVETYLSGMNEQDFADYAPDFVYITVDRDLAYDFAVKTAQFGKGASLYRVAPKGVPSHDADFPEGVAFKCRMANVLEVAVEEFDEKTQQTRVAQGYMTWDDGVPIYDAAGYALPSKTAAYLGVKSEDLRSLGRWSEFENIHAALIRHIEKIRPGITPAEGARIREAAGAPPMRGPGFGSRFTRP